MAYGFVLAAITLLLGRVYLATCTDMPTDAGQVCDSADTVVVGNNATRETNAERAVISRTTLYLDIDNPAPCTGNITSWTICYYNNLGGDPGGRRRRSRSRRSDTSGMQNNNMTPQEDSRSILFAIYSQRTQGRSENEDSSRLRYEQVSNTYEFTVTAPGK